MLERGPQKSWDRYKEETHHGYILEKLASQILPQGAGASCPHAQRESKSPPAHVEGKRPRGPQDDESKAHPSQGKPPHDDAEEDAEEVEELGTAGGIHAGDVEHFRVGDDFEGDFAELLDAEAALAKGPDGEEDGDDDLSRGQRMDRQAVEVEGHDAGGEGLADAPEDVGDDERGVGVADVGQGVGDDAAGGCGDDGRDDGQEERGGGVLEAGAVAVHDDEGHGDCGCEGDEDVDPPEGPGEVDEPGAPLGAGEDHHVDDCCDVLVVVVRF